jgi:hypothetical protein
MLKDKWIVNFDFNEFTLYEKDQMPIPLNISFGGSICLSTDLAQRIIDKNVRVVDGKLHKMNFNKIVLYDFFHTYLFLECVRNGKLIGIEPRCGIKIVADGEALTYKKKLYLELIIMRFALELKTYYPWFKEACLNINSFFRYLKVLITLGAIVSEKPEFEEAYTANYKTLMAVLKKDNRNLEILLSKLYERIRKSALVKFLVIGLHRHARKLMGAPLDSRADTNPVLDRNLAYTIAEVEKIVED